MNIIEIKNQLIAHFLKEDTFSFKSHLKGIKVSKNQEDFKFDLVFSVLFALEEAGLILGSGADDDQTLAFTLQAPLGSLDQQVIVSGFTANAVGDIINEYRTALGIKDGTCDKLALCDMDIQNLCHIIGQLTQGVDQRKPL